MTDDMIEAMARRIMRCNRDYGPDEVPAQDNPSEYEMAMAKAALAAAQPYIEAEKAKAVAAERERCAKVCKEQEEIFASPKYSTGQPLSSFKERFACDQCAKAIRAGDSHG